MSLNDITLDDLAGTDTAVVGTLGGGETVGGPAIRPVGDIEESVLLLKTEPGLVLSVGLHDPVSLVAVVELVGGAIGVPALGKNEDVVTTGGAERIGEDSDGFQLRIRQSGLLG